MWSISVGRRPAITSSSSRIFGPVASARATSSRLRSGSVSEEAMWSRLGPSPSCSITSPAFCLASRTPAVALSAPTMTFSITVRPANGFTSWKVRPTPARQIWSERQPSMRCPAKPHLAGIGPIDAGDQVEAGGLAGAVGADQRDDLALGHGEAHLLHGPQAAEALRHRADLEQRRHVSLRRPRRACRPRVRLPSSPSALLSGGQTPSGRNMTTTSRQTP